MILGFWGKTRTLPNKTWGSGGYHFVSIADSISSLNLVCCTIMLCLTGGVEGILSGQLQPPGGHEGQSGFSEECPRGETKACESKISQLLVKCVF